MPAFLSDEQKFVQEAAADALSRVCSLESIRAALDGAELVQQWATAVEAGWTGLLVDEEAGGAGLGPTEAALVLAEAGRRLAPLPLIGHLVGTAAIAAADPGDPRLAALAGGELRAAAVLGSASVSADEGGRLSGSGGLTPDLPGADVLVVITAASAWCVDADAVGLVVEAIDSFDPSVAVARPSFSGAAASALALDTAARNRVCALAHLLVAASLCGTGRSALELGVEYAKQRFAFARPIGSFQAIKHGLVEVLRRLEVAEVLVRDACSEYADNPEGFRRRALAARLGAATAVDLATRRCMSVHGGIGVTWEHDAPLYFRRGQLLRRLYGSHDTVSAELAGALLEG